jgi:hypothetical protein
MKNSDQEAKASENSIHSLRNTQWNGAAESYQFERYERGQAGSTDAAPNVLSCRLQVGCLRTTATVFKISCESAASRTALAQVLRSPVVSVLEQFEIAGHLAFNR